MKYAYEDLSPEQFETLVIFICQKLLGISVQGFSTGKDGGRDAKFVGTAELHPSKADPWVGTVIIQAKHTNGINKLFSEPDFFSKVSDDTVVGEELPRIKRLKDSEELDHYMLFSNRRLTGNAEQDIRSHISKTCNIPYDSIYLCGIEHLEILLKSFPDIVNLTEIDPIDSPLIVSPEELSEVVEAFAQNKKVIKEFAGIPPKPRISYEEKNELNNMDKDYAKKLRRNYLKDTRPIQTFLADPENEKYKLLYETTAEEFQLKIASKRKDYQEFNEIMEYLSDLLFKRDPLLRSKKRLTRTFLFYMYWYCDIGRTEEDAQADEALTS